MDTIQIIRSKFSFLVEEFNFRKVKEETKEITALDYQFEVVHYSNQFVLIEIGGSDGLGGYSIGLEIRRIKNGTPADYNDIQKSVNLQDLQKLTAKINNENEITYVANFDDLASLLKKNIHYFTSNNWYTESILKKIKEDKKYDFDKTLNQIEEANKEFLNANDFNFLKSNKTISSFEVSEHSFFTYSNGLKKLTVEYNVDVREQYFCYHIYFTGGNFKGVPCIENVVQVVGEEIKKMITEC